MPSPEPPQPSFSVGALAPPASCVLDQTGAAGDTLNARQAIELEDYRAIFELAPVGMCCVDLHGRFVLVNSCFCTMVGYSQDELFGMTFMELTHPDDRGDGLDALHAMLAGELDTYVKEKRYVSKGGEVVWINITTTLRRAASGRPLFTIGVIQPIGRRRQAERALRESEQRFRTLFEQAPFSVQLLGTDGRTLMVNHAWIDLWQTTRETVDSFILTDYKILADPQVVATGLLPYLQRAYAGESVITPPVFYDPALAGKPGRPRWAMAFVHPVKDDGGQVREVMLIHHDVSEQIEVQAQLQRAKEAAESASRLKSAFLANMSHELRTPLGAILGFSELLRDDQLGAGERTAYLDIVARNGAVLTRIIDDVLDLSRVEAGILHISRQSFDLQASIAEVMELFAGEAATKNLLMRWSAAAQAPRVIVSDPVRLKQILINLIGNALKFTQHGDISVELEPVDALTGQFTISISDTGIGIPARHQDKLFRPFSQVDYDHSRQFGGTGLGLALSQRLAHALGGDVRLAASAPGQGSRFVVSLAFVDAPGVSPPATIGAGLLPEALLPGDEVGPRAEGRQGARSEPVLAPCLSETYVRDASSREAGLREAGSDKTTSGAPSSGAPSSGAPSSGAPSSGAPSSGAPSSGAPSSGAPSSGAPSSGAPSSGESSSGESSSGAPSSGEMSQAQVSRASSSPVKGLRRLEGRRILVVDDAADNRLLLLRLLEKHGAGVELAHHGQEALAKVGLDPYDVIIMDMQMPVMDGFKATRAIRRQGFQKAIVALTAHAMKAQLQRCLDVGCDAYLSKPFVFEHLVSLVAHYCSEGIQLQHDKRGPAELR